MSFDQNGKDKAGEKNPVINAFRVHCAGDYKHVQMEKEMVLL